MCLHQMTTINIKPSFSEVAIYHYLSEAKRFYPNFDLWYFTNVLSSIARKEKQILMIQDDKDLKGVSIIKNTQEEKKICTLRVMEKYQNRGIGLRLFEKSFETLQTRFPLLSVSEEKYPDFKKIFDYYGFKLTSIKENYYRIGKKEFFFNENL
ncbi:MAG TPA: GNAT family N-acetyltransferase [Candidatus Helicobacter avistercoris]|nr:GNAT family N-acetyltransferase [Candidatus Helicobacter avistercoris]